MTTRPTHPNRIARGLLLLACAAAIAVGLWQPARAHAKPAPPPTPPELAVPAGNKVFLAGHASGTQQYMCLFDGSHFVWSFFGPQATLFKGNGKPFITHYLSPNPAEGGVPRATWQNMNDGSVVWAAPIGSSTDPNYVVPGAIPWLLLEVKGVQPGQHGGANLAATTFIQRLNTAGGVAPSSGCAEQGDIGKKALVPYTTDYFFYKAAGGE
jgi:hypothetical protein